jgi:hypothetical protein
MKRTALFFTFLLFIFTEGFSQSGFHTKENGLNLQSYSGRIAFIPENSKMKVRLYNGTEVSGRLTGADSNQLFISRSASGKQVIVDIKSIKKITVFHEGNYFGLTEDMFDWGWGCGDSGCDAVAAVIVVGVVAVVVVGELIVEGIVDIANDEHYDLQREWKVSGPVVGR